MRCVSCFFFFHLLASSGTLCKTCVQPMFIWGNYAPLLTISAFVCSCVCTATQIQATAMRWWLHTSAADKLRNSKPRKCSLLLLLRLKVHKVPRRPSLLKSSSHRAMLMTFELLFCSPQFPGVGLSNRQSLTLVKQYLVLFCSAMSKLGELVKWFRSMAAVPN